MGLPRAEPPGLASTSSASRECDSICPQHRLRGFATDAAGTVTALGELAVDDAVDHPEPPAWLAGAARCTRWLFVCTLGASYCPPG